MSRLPNGIKGEVERAYKRMLYKIAERRGIDPKMVDEGKLALDDQGLVVFRKSGRISHHNLFASQNQGEVE